MKNLKLGLCLLSACTLLGACVTAQDKALASSLDCQGLQAAERYSPTSHNSILNDLQSNDLSQSVKNDNILNQSRTNERRSALRREYAKRC